MNGRLDDATFAAWAEGQALTPEQAVAYALEPLPSAPITVVPHQPRHSIIALKTVFILGLEMIIETGTTWP